MPFRVLNQKKDFFGLVYDFKITNSFNHDFKFAIHGTTIDNVICLADYHTIKEAEVALANIYVFFQNHPDPGCTIYPFD